MDPLEGSPRSLPLPDDPTGQESETVEAAIPDEEGPSAARRALTGFFGLAIVVGSGLAAVPWILSHTSFGDRAMSLVSERLPEGTSLGRPLLGWFEPVGVGGIRYEDGETEITIDAARTDRTIWQLLIGDRLPKAISLNGVRGTLVFDSDSNGEAGADSLLATLEHLPAMSIRDAAFSVRPSPEQQPIVVTIASAQLGPDESGTRSIAMEGHLGMGNESSAFTVQGTMQPTAAAFDLSLQANDARVSSLLAEVFPSATVPLSSRGDLTATASRKANEESIAVRFGYEASRTSWQASAEDAIAIPNLKLTARGTLGRDASRVHIDEAVLVSDVATAAVVGDWELAAPTDASRSKIEANVNIAGSLLTQIGLPPAVRVQSLAVNGIVVEQVLTEDGSVISSRGRATWPKAVAYGLPSENGEANWSVRGESAAIELSKVPLGTGRAVGQYQIDWTHDPTLSFAGGPMLERVALTERLCRDWLQYVSPLVAEASDVSGTFSLAMGPFAMPLSARPREASGVVTVHEGSIKAGPLSERLLGRAGGLGELLNRPGVANRIGGLAERPLLTLPPQQVPFAIDQGGIAHERFAAAAGRLSIQTSGRVGFDRRLDVQTQLVPPQRDPNGAGDRPILDAVLSQPITIAVSGTMDEPQIARGSLRATGKEALRGAASGLLRQLRDR